MNALAASSSKVDVLKDALVNFDLSHARTKPNA